MSAGLALVASHLDKAEPFVHFDLVVAPVPEAVVLGYPIVLVVFAIFLVGHVTISVPGRSSKPPSS